MIALKILRFFLPPFHPLKYRYLNWWYGTQSNSGGWKDNNSKEMKKTKF
jgi:hypothetical protein